MSIDTQYQTSPVLFVIPDELNQKVPCQVSPQLYDDPALDIDLDESEWIALSGEQQRARLQLKVSAEQRAIAACNTCPLLQECRDWAMTSGVEVYGVVGGTTPEERRSVVSRRIIDDPGVSRRSKAERDDIIAELMEASVPNKTIAERLGCSVRTVERRKAAIRSRTEGAVQTTGDSTRSVADLIVETGSVEVIERSNNDEAMNDLMPGRVTAETAAIFDALMDGSVRDRNSLIEELVSTVSDEQALKFAPKSRDYETEDARRKAGARKFLMNRLDIAMRRGRVRFMKTANRDVLVGLDEQTARVWSSYRSNNSSSAA